MTEILQIGHQTITALELIPRLASYQMLPQLKQEILIEEAISPITCTPEEQASACDRSYCCCFLFCFLPHHDQYITRQCCSDKSETLVGNWGRVSLSNPTTVLTFDD